MRRGILALALATSTLLSGTSAFAGGYGAVVNPAKILRVRPAQVTAYDAVMRGLDYNLARQLPSAAASSPWRVQFGRSVLGTTFRAVSRDASGGILIAKGTVGSNHSSPAPSDFELNSVRFTLRPAKK